MQIILKKLQTLLHFLVAAKPIPNQLGIRLGVASIETAGVGGRRKEYGGYKGTAA